MLNRMVGEDMGLFDPTYSTTPSDAESLPGYAQSYRMDFDHAAGSVGLRDAWKRCMEEMRGFYVYYRRICS